MQSSTTHVRGVSLGAAAALVLALLVTPLAAATNEGTPVAAGRYIVGWGLNGFGQTGPFPVPTNNNNAEFKAVAAGDRVTLGLRFDGSVVSTQTGAPAGVPALPPGVAFRAIAQGGGGNSAGLRSDGRIHTWGFHQPGLTHGLWEAPAGSGTDFTAVAAGPTHILGLATVSPATTGQVIVRGPANEHAVTTVPALPGGMAYTEAMAVGSNFAAVVRSDGKLVTWGNNSATQAPGVIDPPVGSTSFTRVALGQEHGIALTNTGQIYAWGCNCAAVNNVPALPTGVTYTAVSAQSHTSAALRSDGVIVVWGAARQVYGVPAENHPPAGTQFVRVAAGADHVVGLHSYQTTTTTATWPSSAQFGSVVAVPVTVTTGTGTPTGTVQITSGATVLGSAALSSGSATVTIPAGLLTVGTHTLVARYLGSASHRLSNSASHALTVTKSSVTVAATWQTSAWVSTAARTVRIDVTTEASVQPSGVVEIHREGHAPLGTATLSGGSADIVIPAGTLPPGNHTLVAYYGGDANFDPNLSAARTVTVVAPSTTAVTWPKSWRYGKTATATVRVASPTSTPRGRVEIRAGSTVLGAANLKADGTAKVKLAKLSRKPGTPTLRAYYLGSTTHAASSSATKKLKVTKAKTTASVKLVKKTVKPTVKPKVTLRVKASGIAAPKGTVQIKVGKKTVRTVKLTAKHRGARTVTIPKIAKTGKHKVRVVFRATALQTKATSKTKTLTIKR